MRGPALLPLFLLAAGCGAGPEEAPVPPPPPPPPLPALPVAPPPEPPKRDHRAEVAAARAEVVALLRDDRPGEEPAIRARSLALVAGRAREFLSAHPDGDPDGEIAAGAAGAEAESKRCRAYADAYARARDALDEKRWDAAVAAADEAIRIRPGDEARTIRLQALRNAAPAGMVYVPPGPALLGRNRETTAVAGFYIDRTEVTCARYGEFLAATKGSPPVTWNGAEPPKGKEGHPVVNLSGEQAAAYAKWAGKRLPTELEWEKAARGTDGRTFPWGDAFDEGKGNFGAAGTRPAGENPADASPFGLLDAGGNAAEFTVPLLGFQKVAGRLEENRPRWVVKGGHWGGAKRPDDNALFLRYPFQAGEGDGATGFRCALDAR